MTKISRVVTFVFALGLGSGLASATTITQTFTLDPTATEILNGVGTGTFNNFLTACPGCDAGWLTSVTLEMKVDGNLTGLSVTNTSGSPQSFQYFSSLNLTIVGSSPDDALINTALRTASVANNGHYIDLIDTGTLTYAAGETKTFAPPTITTSLDSGAKSVTLTPYDTTGTFTLGFTTSTTQAYSGAGGNGINSQSTTADGLITVVYNYTNPGDVPEPATMAMMGGALLGLGLMRKRFKA